MGKKERRFITLSEVDHKLQFINVIAVIAEITPTIYRSKLTKIELCLLDETVKRPGFNVKLNMEIEMLNHFLNVAKRGFIIQLNDIKVTKNEGEVYGEVQEEEEITFYNDSPHVHKWYPGEKPAAVTDTTKLKILSMVKWKKANFKDIEVLQESNEDQSKTRRSGLTSDGKSQSSKSLNKISINDGSTVSNNKTQRITANDQEVEDNLSVSKENKLEGAVSKRSRLERSTSINKLTKQIKSNKTLISSEESQSTNSSRASILSRTSQVTRATDAFNLSKSLSLSNLNKSVTTRSLNKSSSLSRINKSDICKRNKSLSLSKLNKSKSQSNLNNSKVSFSRQNLTKGVKAKKRESESLKSVRLTRSISTSKIKEITSSSDSNIDETSIDQSSSETHSYSFSSTTHKPNKENNKDKNLTRTQSFAENKNKDISIINTQKKSLRNKKADFTGSKNDPANEEQSKCLDSKTEKVIPVIKHPQNNQRDFASKDTKKNIATVKSNETKINRNKQYNAAIIHGKVEARGATKSESNCEVLTKVKNKEAEKKSINEEKLSNVETLKRTRQMIKNKTEGSPSVSKTDCLVINNSNSSSPNTTPELRKSECNTSRESRRKKNVLVDKTEVNNQLKKNIHNRNSLARTKETYSGTDSSPRKKIRLTYGSGQLSDTTTSSETSHKSKLKLCILGKNPTLNTSDSTLSESSNHSVNKINSSRESLHMQKRDLNQIDIPSELLSVSRKRLKLDQEIGANKSERSRPSLENDLSNLVNEEQTGKSTKTSETKGKCKENGNENDSGTGLSNKGGNSGPYLNTNGNRKLEKNEDIRKTTRLDKEDKTLPKTRKQDFEKSQPNDDKQSRSTTNCTNNSVKNNRESGKGGTFETYLRPFTKKLNFISVENITDISLYDLEEVYVPEKFDLQCKVVSEFVLFEEGIQVVRVEDGTLCKCDTLKIPPGHSWDIISKEVLNNPVVEEKSRYIDVIIFNYFRLEFPIKPDKFFRINNIMAVKFQLKRDPRENKKSKSEFFFCVEGQNTNIRKLSPQQVKELQERIAAAPQKSTLSATMSDKAVAEKPVSDLHNFKLPTSPKMDGKSNMSSDKNSSIKTKPVIEESGSRLKPKTRRINDSDSDIDPDVISPRGRSPAEDKTIKENLRKKSETCMGNVKTYENLEAKTNTTNSSDETMMGETPPLMREINEIIQEESALGLPLTITEDVHLKNSGSEVTFSQFCEGAKLKGDNFRTSTQDIEADVQNIDFSIVRKLSDLPKDVLVPNKEITQSEDTNKMEPLVYCPSGSSASSAVCGSPDKGKTPQDTQYSQQCSASVLHGARVKSISNLKPDNLESQKVISNSSDLSNSSSVKIISSNSSIGVDLEVLVSKNVSKNQTTTKVTEVEVESTVSSEVKKVSSSTSKSSALPKDKVSGSVLESVCISGNTLNQASSNDDIEVVSDNSSNASLLAADNNTTIKPAFNASANVIDDVTVHNLERAKLIPDRCFYKSPTTPPTLTEHELNEIYDDENSLVKYFSYCHDRDLPMLTLDVIRKIRNTNSLAMTVTFVNISPALTDSWKEGCIKARCPSCDKLYDVFDAANNKNHENPSATAAISVGSHIVCPDSQCSNQILENPEFHFSVEFKLEDGTLLTALLGGQHAEDVFGCSAPEAMRNESALSRVAEILEKITKRVSDKHPTKVVVKRQDVCNPKSGPLCLAHVGV